MEINVMRGVTMDVGTNLLMGMGDDRHERLTKDERGRDRRNGTNGVGEDKTTSGSGDGLGGKEKR